MYLFVKITKRCRAENACFEPGCWDSYKIGQSNDNASLPVDYVMVGILATPLIVGGICQLLRIERNGIMALGVFKSTIIREIFDDGFVTQNSVYMVEPMDLIKYLDGQPNAEMLGSPAPPASPQGTGHHP